MTRKYSDVECNIFYTSKLPSNHFPLSSHCISASRRKERELTHSSTSTAASCLLSPDHRCHHRRYSPLLHHDPPTNWSNHLDPSTNKPIKPLCPPTHYQQPPWLDRTTSASTGPLDLITDLIVVASLSLKLIVATSLSESRSHRRRLNPLFFSLKSLSLYHNLVLGLCHRDFRFVFFFVSLGLYIEIFIMIFVWNLGKMCFYRKCVFIIIFYFLKKKLT